MQDNTLQNAMMIIFVIIIIGFFITSFFLIREIIRTKKIDRDTRLFKIEIALFSVCMVGFVGSTIAYFFLF